MPVWGFNALLTTASSCTKAWKDAKGQGLCQHIKHLQDVPAMQMRRMVADRYLGVTRTGNIRWDHRPAGMMHVHATQPANQYKKFLPKPGCICEADPPVAIPRPIRPLHTQDILPPSCLRSADLLCPVTRVLLAKLGKGSDAC